MKYQVILTARVRQLLIEIKDQREQKLILDKLDKLKHDPDKQGKALTKELAGYRSIRTVGQRYRIVYRVVQDRVLVVVVGLGRRREGDKRNVYVITQQLLADFIEGQDADEPEDG